MASLKTLKTQFLEYIEIEKGRSLNTIENYDRYLSRFLGFLKKMTLKTSPMIRFANFAYGSIVSRIYLGKACKEILEFPKITIA